MSVLQDTVGDGVERIVVVTVLEGRRGVPAESILAVIVKLTPV